MGRTGEKVSLIGIGGSHIGQAKEEKEAIRIIRTALDRGVNFLDNSWDYHGGRSEEWMGKALKDGYRQKAFLMSKIDGRTAHSVTRQIDESLRRLQTDHVDLMQFHEVIRLEDPDRIFNEGGMVAMLAARKAGKVRYIGFTGHKDPLVHLRMLEVAALHGFFFDTAQMPVNVMDAHFRSFTEKVLPVLVRQGIGVLAMKPMGSGLIPESGIVSGIECLHYAMTQQVSTVITGIETMERLEQALEAVRTFRPLTQAQVYDLLKRTAQAAATGKFEPFKTTNGFDATAQNPQWLG
ncbi:MAG TPA: aldo/keto reductase [Verrucomicrobiae bacterium]|nr:aldo/keto reductase [Verrucomicrobiae bacterium]